MRIPALTAILLAAFPAIAQEDPIQSTIQSQIEALRSDDFAMAFTYASPTIQGLFGTPENFGMMVQNGYPMVYRPAEVKMLGLRDIAAQQFRHILRRDNDDRRLDVVIEIHGLQLH